MAVTSPLRPEEENQLQQLLWSDELAHNPLNFALANYPWGMKNTPLAKLNGPRGWQREVLQEIAHLIKSNIELDEIGLDMEVLKEAIASGRGIGKSALFGMLSNWNQSCHLGASTILSANTEPQLKSRTMPEVRKWFALGMNAHWWDMEALSVKPQRWFGNLLTRELKIDVGYYYAMAQLWSEENPDAFAGLHNMNGVLLLFDEASGIPTNIWTVSEGFFTDKHLHRYWMAFSNPRRPIGAFADKFDKDKSFWRTRNIDARTVEGTDHSVYVAIIKQYGDDSDEARVEVKGQFPKTGSQQLFSRSDVLEAQQRDVYQDEGEALVMMVDVARYGTDTTIVGFRRGRDARSIPWEKLQKGRLDKQADELELLIDKHDPDHIVIDGNGVGGGLVDIMKERGYIIVDFNSSRAAEDDAKYTNQRAETYHAAADWIFIGALPTDSEFLVELPVVEYHYGAKERRVIKDKDAIRAEIGHSPDRADTLAMSFCKRWARVDRQASRKRARQNRRNRAEVNYNDNLLDWD